MQSFQRSTFILNKITQSAPRVSVCPYNEQNKRYFSTGDVVCGRSMIYSKSRDFENSSSDFYDESQKALMTTVKKLIDQKINPNVDRWEADGLFPAHEVFKIFGDADCLGIHKPIEFGGLGLSFKYNAAFLETLGHINCGAIPMATSVQTDMATPALAWYGSNSLKQQFLAPSIKGDYVSCIGISEPHAGSDVAAIKTSAKRIGDDLVINGSKMWITNGKQADWMCCLVNTSQEKSIHTNKSLVCLDMKSKGITIPRIMDKLGMMSSDTAEIYFDDVRVPASNIIGDEGKGFIYQMTQFQAERLAAALSCLASLNNIIQQTSDYCHTRQIFGRSLIDNQSVHFKLAELQTELESLRALVHKLVDMYDAGKDITTLASMAKLKTGRLARQITDNCLQLWGGMGYTNEVLVSRLYRDMRLISIGGGADEVMLSIIAKNMGNLGAPTKV